MSLAYRTKLATSTALDEWIWTKLSDWEVNASLRNRLAGAAYITALFHHQATLRLIDVELFPSASALVRPLFDSGLAGLWIENCATEAELDRFMRYDQRPKSETMVRKIDKCELLQNNSVSNIKSLNWASMSDYAHCGSRMLQRMIGDDHIGPNFDDDEIVEILGFTGAWALFSVLGIARLSNDLALQSETLKHCEVFVASS